jgi:glycosyltransferase involved in cell wall biosynthesis
MKLLLSAYACAPERGSEHGVGWNWVTQAHRLGHDIWALVSPAHRDSIARACAESPELAGIRWSFPEVWGWPLQQAVEPKWERTYNLLWQFSALRAARLLHREVEFDAVHHVTWAGIRAPTFLGALAAPLVIGPVGGGETSPAKLRDEFGLRGRAVEALRDLSTATILYNPLVRPGFRYASAIFAHTEDTRQVFKGALRDKVTVFTPLSLSDLPACGREPRPRGAPRFLYAGRLLYWKGVHIALRAFAEVCRRAPGARFTIVGDGPERARLEARATRYGVRAQVDFVPRLPQSELFKLYDEQDLFLFPSLHDSGGFVVLEALARGLPVICLDLGGPKDIVTPRSGVVISTHGRNTEQVALEMASQIIRLVEAQDEVQKLSTGARERARDFLLERRVREFYAAAGRAIAQND